MLNINFSPFPNLLSDRLRLRRITADDVYEVFLLRSDPETMKYIPRPLAKNKTDAMDHITMVNKGVADNTSINWAITMKEDNKLIGMICLIRMQPENFRTEIGYILHPAYHGMGIMHEAVGVLINYAFNILGFHSLEAVIDPENKASEQVLLKHNFLKEAHYKENTFYDGKFLDAVVYSLIRPASI